MRAALVTAVLVACGGDATPTDTAAAAGQAVYTPLSDGRLARRMSLDLRGVLPTTDELAAVEAEGIDGFRDSLLVDERLEDRLVYLLGERWYTLTDEYYAEYYDYGLDPEQEYAFERAVGQEPLRLAARVVVDDLPWTEVVTADWTMANDLTAEIWNLERDEGASGWAPARYTDGRPAVGVLATNGLWWRYITNIFNQNRSRAAAITKLLLCEDLLQRPVSFSSGDGLLEAADTSEMVRSDPGCLACHSIIEPLAATLYGFYLVADKSVFEMQAYHPERELAGPEELQVGAAYFGQPVDGLADLGPLIADDPRFTSCAVDTFSSGLLRRPIELDDAALLREFESAFVGDELQVRSLLEAITDSGPYRAGAVTGPDAIVSREVTVRMMSPDQLGMTLEDLTGWTWTYGGFGLLDSDEIGYRVLAGGVDGTFISRPQTDPSLTWALVGQRAAESAAAYVVDVELSDGTSGSAPLLLQLATLDDRPGDPNFGSQLAALHLRLFSEPADDTRLQVYGDLWSDVEAESDPPTAWKALLSAMFRDPEFVTY